MRTLSTKWVALIVFLLIVVIGAGAYYGITTYIDGLPKVAFSLHKGTARAPIYPDARFGVLSDLHFYDTALGTSGAAFEAVLRSDRKMLIESAELLDFALREIKEADLDFLLISGDLTKDGELVNHLKVSEKLQDLVDNGVKVYVTPGNHDLRNFHAEEYIGDGAEQVPSISAAEFREIYARMGYGDAVMSDPNSLSYVAEPLPGLWLLSIDSCRYAENSATGKGAVTGGHIRQEVADWLCGVLQEAIFREKAVIAFMHHGVVEHWNGQAKLHPDYLVEDYVYFAEFLASYKVQLVFTGHYHAQNIAKATFGIDALYDIETGSLVTYPCPTRYMKLENNALSVTSKTIGDRLRPSTEFASKAQQWVQDMVAKEAEDTLLKYKVSSDNASYIASLVAEAFVAHYQGDVDPELRTPLDRSKLNLWGHIVFMTQGYVLDGLWASVPPPDNDAVIPLR